MQHSDSSDKSAEAGSSQTDRTPKYDRSFRLDGKVAVITGASKNIGLEITRAFAEAGATVVGVARTSSVLEERMAEIATETGATVVPISADIRSAEDVENLADEVRARFGQTDVLVNNALSVGDAFGSTIFDIPDSDWEECFLGNVLGPYRLCRAFGRDMAAGRGGSIINVLSGSGFQPTPGVAPYGATKAALWMMTRYLATEGAPKVRVNGLCPGVTESDTGSPEQTVGPQVTEHMTSLVAKVPMGRRGLASEVAPAAVYLASDAASFTTGALLMVNGGRPW